MSCIMCLCTHKRTCGGTAAADIRLATPPLRAALIVSRFKVFALKRKEATLGEFGARTPLTPRDREFRIAMHQVTLPVASATSAFRACIALRDAIADKSD